MRKISFKKLKPYVKGDFRFFLMLFSSICSAALSLIIPVFFGYAIDSLIGFNDVSFDALIQNLIYAIALTAAMCFAEWAKQILSSKIVSRVGQKLRDEAISKLQVMPLNYLDTHQTGETMGVIIGDVEQVVDGLLMGLNQLVSGILTVIGVLVILFIVNWILALVVLCLTPISLLLARFISKHTYVYFKQQSKVRNSQAGLLDEMIGCVKTVQAYGYEERSVKRFEKINEEYKKTSFKAVFYSSLTNPTTRFINALVYAAVALTCAFICMGMIDGVTLTIGMFSAVLSYVNQYTKPFNEITSVITELQNSIACLERITGLIDEKSEIPDAENAVVLDEVKGKIDISHVYFSYVPSRPLIENFNLSVESGKRIAIVGPTGCGKTTLINLLMRFYDVLDGRISVDGIGIKETTRKSLRENFGMVLQESYIMDGTVFENVKLGKPDATLDEVREVCKLCGADGFISRLENGYDTVLKESNELSLGEKQLLCIARVMLIKPPMLILDEATSSVDALTEAKITKAFEKLMEGKTSFIVAHRLSTIMSADTILVMKDGNVIEQGSHSELMAKGGYYRELFNSQYEIAE